jgi:nitric oxide reductase NorD protein
VSGENEPAAAAEQRQPSTRKPTEGFSLAQQPPQQGSDLNVRLYLDQRPVPIPGDMEQLLGSVLQDLGTIPEEYFRPGGQKPYDAGHTGAGSAPDRAPQEYLTDNVLRYPEWDYLRQRFRLDYCMVREHDVVAGDEEFIATTRAKYHGLLKSVRRSFEAIVSENRLQRRQNNGDDIDIDALVAARADARHGEELDDNIYIRLCHDQRSIAVMFMVDMSGSTKGWVNQAEREALVLLGEALETIGDRYAIYGFSGRTHRRVDIYRVKRFDEPYNQQVRGRISGIEPRAYTRMGAPIRHLGALLRQQPARTKLLITLSDGKPEDYGSYYGKYSIEDTRHALLELRRDGIHPFCITIDKEGSDYLPYMYGAANFACIGEVSKLPLKIADIYRKLTT